MFLFRRRVSPATGRRAAAGGAARLRPPFCPAGRAAPAAAEQGQRWAALSVPPAALLLREPGEGSSGLYERKGHADRSWCRCQGRQLPPPLPRLRATLPGRGTGDPAGCGCPCSLLRCTPAVAAEMRNLRNNLTLENQPLINISVCGGVPRKSELKTTVAIPGLSSLAKLLLELELQAGLSQAALPWVGRSTSLDHGYSARRVGKKIPASSTAVLYCRDSVKWEVLQNHSVSVAGWRKATLLSLGSSCEEKLKEFLGIKKRQ